METYLLNPDWQERFPLALVGLGASFCAGYVTGIRNLLLSDV